MTVVDASIVIRLLLNREHDDPLRERFGSAEHLAAPALIDAEVSSAIRGLVRSPTLEVDRAQEMLTDFSTLPLTRYPMQPFQRRVLALRDNFTAYDAFYVALAEALDSPLLTSDAKFARAAAHRAMIETWTDHGHLG